MFLYMLVLDMDFSDIYINSFTSLNCIYLRIYYNKKYAYIETVKNNGWFRPQSGAIINNATDNRGFFERQRVGHTPCFYERVLFVVRTVVDTNLNVQDAAARIAFHPSAIFTEIREPRRE